IRYLSQGYNPKSAALSSDFNFTEHNAWKSPLPLDRDRVVVHGIFKEKQEIDENDKPFTVRSIILTQALAFTDAKNKEVQRRAFETALICDARTGKTVPMTTRMAPWGGQFGDLLVPYLMEIHKDLNNFKPDVNFPDENQYARQSGPPSLIRE